MKELLDLSRLGLEGQISAGRSCYAKPKDFYLRRLKKEIAMIEQKGAGERFHILADITEWARRQGIVTGPGRGVLPGSLTAYCLGITDVDPILHGLIFERFLNHRIRTTPYFSLDFDQREKPKVINYISEKFHSVEDNILLIVNSEMSSRDLLEDVLEKIGFPESKRKTIFNTFPKGSDYSLRDFLEESQLVRLACIDSEVKLLLAILSVAVELPTCIHPNISRVILLPTTGKRAPQPEDLIYFDLIWSDSIRLLHGVLHRIAENSGKNINLGSIPLDDNRSYMLLGKGDTRGIPFWQRYEDKWYISRRLRPKNFSEVTALFSLMRPGSIENGMMDSYVNRSIGDEATEYSVPELQPILCETLGILLYHEQTMMIAHELAGFNLNEAEEFRHDLVQRVAEKVALQKHKFIKGAKENAINQETSEKIFEFLCQYVGYGFLKAHAVAMTTLSIRMAWLKVNYPEEFMAEINCC